MLKSTSKRSLSKSKQSPSQSSTNQKLTSVKLNTKNAQHKKLLTTPKRTKISIGKVQRQSRAESMAENKRLREELISEQSKANISNDQQQEQQEQQQQIQPALQLEQQKRALMTRLDIKRAPRGDPSVHNAILQDLADSNLPWTPIEVGEILSLASKGNATNYKAGSVLVNDLIKRDFVPYKSAIRGLSRLFECAYHYKGANEVATMFNNLFPKTQYDEVGMPIPKVVLTQPLPNFDQIVSLPISPENTDDLVQYTTTLSKSNQNMSPRWQTEHQLLRQHIKNKRTNEIGEQMFHMWHRLGVTKRQGVPKPFDPIPFQTIFPKSGQSAQFKPDFPLYYAATQSLIQSKNWSAAMSTLVFTRTLNRTIDVTPLRELTQNKQWRDYLDLHTHDGQTSRNVVKQLLHELTVRRGYRAEMEAKVPGTDTAVTYSENTRENAMTYSPLIATEPETLVILTDRNYNATDVVRAKGGIEFTTAHHIIDAFAKHGINAQISYGSKLSSTKQFYQHFVDNPTATNGPNAPNNDVPIAFDLTVIVPKTELITYAERTLSNIDQIVSKVADSIPIIPPNNYGIVKKRYIADKKAQKSAIKQQQQ